MKEIPATRADAYVQLRTRSKRPMTELESRALRAAVYNYHDYVRGFVNVRTAVKYGSEAIAVLYEKQTGDVLWKYELTAWVNFHVDKDRPDDLVVTNSIVSQRSVVAIDLTTGKRVEYLCKLEKHRSQYVLPENLEATAVRELTRWPPFDEDYFFTKEYELER